MTYKNNLYICANPIFQRTIVFFILLGTNFFLGPAFASSSTVETKQNIGLSIKQFGAMGDGKTDDTAAIQKALDFALNHKEGNPVVIPAGGYLISKPLVIPKNVDVVGEGLGFTSSIIPINCDAIWVKGDTQEGGYAFRSKIQALNINMRRSSLGKAIVIERAYNIKLSEIFVYDAPETGIYINNAKHINLEGIIVYGAGNKKGIGIKVTDAVVNMYNIDIENIGTALEIGPDKQNNTNVSVFGGFIERFGKYGLNISNESHNTFIGLNIQADSNEKIPVNIGVSSNSTDRVMEKNNTFIGGYIGYSKTTNNSVKKFSKSILEKGSSVINVGE